MNESTYTEPLDQDFGITRRGCAAFSTTLWTEVLEARNGDSPAANQALERLCGAYWYPLYAFIRRRGYGPAEAEDLAQAFFAHILERKALRTVGREKGRFRSFLLVALTNFLNNQYERARAEKRGGKVFLESWEALDGEERYQCEPVDPMTPERLFERRWAFTMVESVLAHLRREYQVAGKLPVFEQLQPFLVAEANANAVTSIGTRLDMKDGAVKVALHRLRRRFGEQLRAQIASTVSSLDEVEDEMRYLFTVVSFKGP